MNEATSLRGFAGSSSTTHGPHLTIPASEVVNARLQHGAFSLVLPSTSTSELLTKDGLTSAFTPSASP